MVIGLLLAVATSVIAAVWPGHAVSKVPVVAALSGRIDPPQLVNRSLRPGLIFLAVGLFILFFSGGASGGGGGGYLVIAGMLCCEIACALLAPFIVDKLSRLAWRAPLAARLALRDLARYRSRSGAALAAVSFAVFIATIAIVIALTPVQVNAARQAAVGLGTTIETKSGQLSMPLIGAIAGWLLSGRAPSAVSRQPLE